MNAEELLAITISEKRLTRIQQTIERQLDDASRQEFEAQVVGYSSEKSAWKLRRLDGSTDYARSVQRFSPSARVFLQGNSIDYL